MTTITSTPGTPEPTNTAPAAQPQQITLQIADLQTLLLVVDLAAQRGAFRANELTQVGQTFDRVSQFLQAAMPPADTTAPATPPPAPPMPAPVMSPVSTSPMAPPFAPKIGG